MLSPGHDACVAIVATLGTIVAGKATEHQHIQGQYSGNPFHVANLRLLSTATQSSTKILLQRCFIYGIFLRNADGKVLFDRWVDE